MCKWLFPSFFSAGGITSYGNSLRVRAHLPYMYLYPCTCIYLMIYYPQCYVTLSLFTLQLLFFTASLEESIFHSSRRNGEKVAFFSACLIIITFFHFFTLSSVFRSCLYHRVFLYCFISSSLLTPLPPPVGIWVWWGCGVVWFG